MINQKTKTLIYSLLLLGFCGVDLRAQNADETPIKVNTVLLNVPVIVSDRDGRNIAGLKKEDFSVYQNGEKQIIEFFADAESPISVAIVIDTSGSTSGFLDSIKKSAKIFLSNLGPEDKAMVVGFDVETTVLTELSSDPNKIKNAINNAASVRQDVWDAPKLGSTLYDTIYQIVVKDFAEVKGRKAIVILTDGFEAGNKISLSKLQNTLIESDTVVYPLIFPTYEVKPLLPKNIKTITINDVLEIAPFKPLKDFAAVTGGRVYVADGDDFKGAFQNIANELKKQYVIGFYPTNAEGGTAGGIKIDVDRKGVAVRTKSVIRLKTPASKGGKNNKSKK